MPIIDHLLNEFTHEAAVTRRVLERLPAEKFDWKPHEKSFTVKELAQHVAEMPGWLPITIETDELDLSGPQPERATIETSEDLLALFDQKVEEFQQAARGVSDETLMSPWRLKNGDEVMFEATKGQTVRGFILNHWVHHRGQLSVYLRLLDVPVPSIYGPSADEDKF